MISELPDHPGLLYSVHIGADGHVVEDYSQRPDAFRCSKGEFVWLHMCAVNPATIEYLEMQTELGEIVIENLLSVETRPRALVRDDSVLLILRAMNLNEGADPEDMISLRLWMDDKHIVSTRLRDTRSVRDMRQMISEAMPPPTVSRFLTMITDRIFERMGPFVEAQDDVIGQMEEQLARDDLDPVNNNLSNIRLQNAIYRRHIIPQRKALQDLLNGELSWLEEIDRDRLTESLDRVTRYVEILNDARDRLAIINDETSRRHDRSLSKTTHIFTAAATIFLPLSFITGLFGINVAGLPGLDYEPSFAILVAACIAMVLAQVIFFIRKGWF